MPIVVEHLTYTYGQGTPFEVRALDDINLHIGDKEFLGIIGQTGSGKSTLIQHLNGLIKATEGRVLVNGIDLTDKSANLRIVRQSVGLVFQYPEHQLFEETIYKDVAFGPKNLGLPDEKVKERVHEALELVGLDANTMVDRSPFELSGGQMRRVAIAGVLAMQPQILILDEPTAGLDPRGRDEILDQLVSLHERKSMTVVLVSHSMEEIARVATRLIVMHDGKIIVQGSPREVFTDAQRLRSIGLGVPQVAELMQALQQRGYQVPPVALTVGEARQAILGLSAKGAGGR